MNESYLKEGMDLRRLFLLFLGKLWIAAAAAVLGGLIGTGVYLLTHLVVMSQKEYQSVSKVYLDFDVKPEDMVHLAYNGYTWNDLMDTDPILDNTMKGLPDGTSREEVMAATEATILSDIRLLTVTVTTGDPELTGRITAATLGALKHLGETEPLFREIAIYRTGEAALVLWDNRTVRAAATGAVIAVCLWLLGSAAWYILDDSLYTGKDARCKLGLPATGILTKKDQKALPFLEENCLTGLGFLMNQGNVTVVHPEGEAAARDTVSRLVELCGKRQGEQRQAEWKERLRGSGLPIPGENTETGSESGGCLLLAVPYGSKNGSRMRLLIESMEHWGRPIRGILITEADSSFLRAYYYLKRTGGNETEMRQT